MNPILTTQVRELKLSIFLTNLYSDSCHSSKFPLCVIFIYVSFGPSLRFVYDYIYLASIKSPRSELQCANLNKVKHIS